MVSRKIVNENNCKKKKNCNPRRNHNITNPTLLIQRKQISNGKYSYLYFLELKKYTFLHILTIK